MKARSSTPFPREDSLSPEEVKRLNLLHFGKKIKAFRLRAGLSADQLADALGVSKSSVRNWECGLNRPDAEVLFRMFSVLRAEPNEFFGLRGASSHLEARERSLLLLFRSLDESGKEDAAALLEAMASLSSRRRLQSARERMCAVPDWGRFASAGDGADWPEHPERDQVILLAGPAANSADEVITVTGRSMEPQFSDGDRVLIRHCADLKNGDIGIFYVPGMGGVIKQKAYDRLHSLNPDFDDIFPYEEGARVVGRVLGKIEPSMIPPPEEQSLYLEAVQSLPV